jgi:hypothetical protein
VSGPVTWHGIQPRHRVLDRRGDAAPTTDERSNLTDHVTRHNQDDGLFRTAGQADEREVASDVADDRPVMRPSRDLFQAVRHDAAERLHSTTKRDEAVAAVSLRRRQLSIADKSNAARAPSESLLAY